VRLLDLIALSELQTASAAFGTKYEYAISLRVLHWLTMEEIHGAEANVATSGSSGTAVGGSVLSEKEGDLARQYGSSLVVAQRFPDLSSTQYGQELLGLMRACIVKARTRAVGNPTIEGLIT
jgi:hypothetical protein